MLLWITLVLFGATVVGFWFGYEIGYRNGREDMYNDLKNNDQRI